MLIKSRSLDSYRVPHELGPKTIDGKYSVTHPPNCECQMIYSVNHARWVSYDAMHGIASCARCDTKLDLPLPAVRENWASKRVYMNLAAIEDELWRFQQKHENCPALLLPPPPEQPQS